MRQTSVLRYNRRMARRVEIVATADDHKMRLDDMLFDRFGSLSKMYLRELIKNGQCEINGRWENSGYKMRSSDFVEIEVDSTRETAMRAEDIEIDVVFEDVHLMVVNKPAGMLVHPTHRDKNGTLLNALTFYLNDRGNELKGNARGRIRPGLVHRLDKQTSGLMVIAKNEKTHRKLAEQFRRKLVQKRYMAVVDGTVTQDDGEIDLPIGRFAEKKMWDVKADGKSARTRFWVKKRDGKFTWLELEPVTGRTNQLRIHCAAIGHPICGDLIRGGTENERLCLHAYSISFQHPITKEDLKFQADADF